MIKRHIFTETHQGTSTLSKKKNPEVHWRVYEIYGRCFPYRYLQEEMEVHIHPEIINLYCLKANAQDVILFAKIIVTI
jgi:hypothetical protein